MKRCFIHNLEGSIGKTIHAVPRIRGAESQDEAALRARPEMVEMVV